MSPLRRVSFPLLTLLGMVAAACAPAGGPRDEVVAEATIGPAGGVLAVEDGELRGLLLSVPPGAMARTETLRVVRPAFASTSTVPPVGPFVRLEPRDQEFLVPVPLRLPYYPLNLGTTGPGNVRARHTSALGERVLVPIDVDVHAGRLLVEIAILGDFRIVLGDQQTGLDGYLPALDTVLPFTDGFTFERNQVADEPNIAQPVERWTFGNGDGAAGVYLTPFQLEQVGRFSRADDWQEVWREPRRLFRHESMPGFDPTPVLATVYSPYGTSLVTGQGTVGLAGSWRFAAPLRIGSSYLLDVLELTILTTWNRTDIGRGQELAVLSFAPGYGLVTVQRDGSTFVRSDL